jgi:hypothetical protein
MDELENYLNLILSVLGLLPHEMRAIKDLKLRTAPKILFSGLLMVRDEVKKLKEEAFGDLRNNDTSIFSRIKKSNNLIIQGYTFAMLSD